MTKAINDSKNTLKKESHRFAYLIIAHKDDLALRTLIDMLDDTRNDIFIHMDKKNKSFDAESIKKHVKYSKICIISPRISVSWGGYSLIKAELLLLKEATRQGNYAYYHLVSGQDLPIKTQNFIHDFFDKNQGKEFIRFQNTVFQYESRIRYYYFLHEIIGRSATMPLRIANKSIIFTQKYLHIHRNKHINFQKGTNWFSITDDLAKYVVNKEPWIRKTFRNTICCDEVFLQTIVINSEFKDRLYCKKLDNNPHAIMRLIDWQRGKPYIFRDSDFGEIQKSEYLFMRKVDPIIDKSIIKRIQKAYNS